MNLSLSQEEYHIFLNMTNMNALFTYSSLHLVEVAHPLFLELGGCAEQWSCIWHGHGFGGSAILKAERSGNLQDDQQVHNQIQQQMSFSNQGLWQTSRSIERDNARAHCLIRSAVSGLSCCCLWRRFPGRFDFQESHKCWCCGKVCGTSVI